MITTGLAWFPSRTYCRSFDRRLVEKNVKGARRSVSSPSGTNRCHSISVVQGSETLNTTEHFDERERDRGTVAIRFSLGVIVIYQTSYYKPRIGRRGLSRISAAVPYAGYVGVITHHPQLRWIFYPSTPARTRSMCRIRAYTSY